MGRLGAVRPAAAARGRRALSASGRSERWGHRPRRRGADVTTWVFAPEPGCRSPGGGSSEAAGGQFGTITAAPIATAGTIAGGIPVPSCREPHGVQKLSFCRGSDHDWQIRRRCLRRAMAPARPQSATRDGCCDDLGSTKTMIWWIPGPCLSTCEKAASSPRRKLTRN